MCAQQLHHDGRRITDYRCTCSPEFTHIEGKGVHTAKMLTFESIKKIDLSIDSFISKHYKNK